MVDDEHHDHHQAGWWPGVNRRLLVVKAAYCGYFGSLVCVLPYLPVYYKMIGISESYIGILTGVRPFVSATTAPLWGALADRTGHKKYILFGTLAVATVARFCTKYPRGFWPLLLLSFNSTAAPLMDSGALDILENKGDFGKQRAWGAVGWGTFSLITGAVIDATAMNSLFYMHIIIAAMTMALATIYPFRKRVTLVKLPTTELQVESNNGNVSGATSSDDEPMLRSRARAPTIAAPTFLQHYIEAFSVVVKDIYTASFYAIMCVIGACMGIIENYLFLYLQELHASKTLMGLSLTVTCIAEVPVLFFSGRIIELLTIQGTLVLVLLCYFVRLGFYSIMPSAWTVLFVEPLHGITFGCAYASGTLQSSELAPPGLESTMQSIMTSCIFGLGFGVGSLIGGTVYDHFGAVVLFRSCAITVLLCTVVFIGVRTKYKPSLASSAYSALVVESSRQQKRKALHTVTNDFGYGSGHSSSSGQPSDAESLGRLRAV
eukprot:jgi/Chlat1/7698/Chrsp64S07146